MKTEERCLSLSGRWELSWTELGNGSFAQLDALFAGKNKASCVVPGDVHVALTEAGVISEPTEALNSLECRWMENQEFWYRKRFFVEDGFLCDAVEITFEGLDTTADIWLNGKYLGRCNNAFIEHTLDISDCIHTGENELVVRLDEGVEAVRDKPLEFTRHAWNNDQPYRAWMRKPQFVYGWDWTIWLPTCGIWKDVTIRSYRAAALRDVYVRTCSDTEDIRRAESVFLNVDVETEFLRPGAYTLRCEILEDPRYSSGDLAASAEKTLGVEALPAFCSVRLAMPIREPKLWWPNGSGRPYLYTVKVSLWDMEGNLLQQRLQRHGIRTVAIREDVLDEKSKSFTYVINGERIFCKGANHVPADCFPGRISAEKNSALLHAAVDANMNMIRVWGGGVYESECFMELCDELGLMVWHDFMFACMYYPDHDPEFYEEIRRETSAAIRRLRKFSCLIGWSGNNEIQEMYNSVRQWKPEHPWYGGTLYENLLPEQVAKLCPDRIYRQSSPFGGIVPDSYDEGDQHTWHFTHRPNWEHYLDLWRFTDFDFKFLSEFGIIGAMNLESVERCIRADSLTPSSPEWKHHTNNSQDHSLLDVFVDTYFGMDSVRDMQDYILKSQAVQAEIMRHIYDELRTRKFRCSGVLLWTLSDSYGIHNWSVIDYYLRKRPVYHYLKRSMAPVNVAFRGYDVQCFDGMAGYQEYYRNAPEGVELLAANDCLQEKAVTVEYRTLSFDGKIYKEGTVETVLPANSVRNIGCVEFAEDMIPEQTVLYVRVLENGQMISENHYFYAPYGKLQLQKANITCKIKKMNDGQAELTLCADTFVWLLHLKAQENVEFADNDFVLLPGVSRKVILTGENAPKLPEFVCLNPCV